MDRREDRFGVELESIPVIRWYVERWERHAYSAASHDYLIDFESVLEALREAKAAKQIFRFVAPLGTPAHQIERLMALGARRS